MKQLEKTPWIIKSGGRILGPFSYNEIVEKLESREILVLDEVARPFKRWVYIRDEAAFAQVVEELRLRNLIEGDSTVATSTPTFTMSITQPIEDLLKDELTEEIPRFRDENIQEIEFDEVETHQTTSYPKGKNFAYQGEKQIRERAQESTRILWAVSALVILLVAGYVFLRQREARKDRLLDFRKEALVALAAGEYQNALSQFRLAYDLDPDDHRLYMYLAVLQMALEGQTLEARRLLNEALNDGRYMERVYNALGLAEVYENNLASAEDYFSKASEVDKYYSEALINMATVRIMKEDYKTAEEYLREVTINPKYKDHDAAAPILLAEALILQSDNGRQGDFLSRADGILSRHISRNYEYVQEAAFMKVYSQFLQGRLALDGDKVLETILDLDPLQTSLHRQNLFVFRGRTDWNFLMKWCLQMTEGAQPSARIKALQALCYAKADKIEKAKREIEDAVAQAPRDALIQSVYYFVLKEAGLDSAAVTALRRAVEFNGDSRYQLPWVLQGRACLESEEWGCARREFKKLFELNSKNITALAGLAHVSLQLKEFADAKRYFDMGSALAPEYRPLLRWKLLAEAEKLVPPVPLGEDKL